MKILALEFSSAQRSVAVIDAEKNSASEIVETSSHNSMKPLDMVERALTQAGLEREQIECIVIGLGRGLTRASASPSRWRKAGNWRRA